MPKIAACLIVKDDTESDKLRNCLNSFAKHVDHIFITGTKNPQDKIKAICKEYGATWSWFEWIKDFSAARNYNFSQAKGYDWIFWCDTDDVVVGAENFRSAIEHAEPLNIKAIFARYLYQVEIDPKTGEIKQILIEHLRERLIRNDGTFEWIAPIHETLMEKVPAGKTDYNDFMVVHMTTEAEMYESMYRNIEILEEEVKRNPQDPRPIYYLAKAYFDTKEPMILYDKLGNGLDSVTMELFKDYIRKSGWPEERAQCWEYMSMVHRERNEFKDAIVCLLEALSEAPEFPSIYIQLALCYVVQRDWPKAMHWVKIAGKVEMPKTTLVINPRDYKAMILEALFHIYINTGKLEECEKVCQGLVEAVPNDLNFSRLRDIQDVRRRNDLAHWTVKLAHHLHSTQQTDKLKALINSIPVEIANEPVLVDLRNQVAPPKTWDDDSVVIYCGPGWEKWSPKNAAKGIGGSEEAVIHISTELAKLGWKVTVYGDPQDEAGDYEGVSWRPYYEVNWNDNFNILISWRQIGMYDLPIKARKSYLWNHDIQNPLTYTPERVNKITKAMFLSKWHRANVPSLDESKVMYTGNGLNI
jgi:tetratricopeptide (TPR) repeat protein